MQNEGHGARDVPQWMESCIGDSSSVLFREFEVLARRSGPESRSPSMQLTPESLYTKLGW